MKKNIILFAFLTVIPYVMCWMFGFFFEEISIGQGDYQIEHHKLHKDVLIEVQGLYKHIDVEEYILGVLPSVVPANYDDEMLKVQAILVRTNLLKEMEENGTADGKDLSYTYLTVDEQIELFGKRNYEKQRKRFEKAVVATSGVVLRKEGNLIMALYHEVSIGETVSGQEILGEDISYLQSVESRKDVEAKHYMTVLEYDFDKIAELAGLKAQEEIVEVKIEESSEHGYVKKASVGGNIYSGEELAKLFELPSTNFYVEKLENQLRFVCLGKGSGLGLSQYGGNCMAIEGKTYEDIIKYYYQKVSIEQYKK